MGDCRRGRVGLQARVHRVAADLEKLPRLLKELPIFLEKLSALARPGLLEWGREGWAASSSSLLGRRNDLRPSCTGGGGDGGGDGGCGYGGCGDSSCGNEGGDREGGE